MAKCGPVWTVKTDRGTVEVNAFSRETAKCLCEEAGYKVLSIFLKDEDT